MESWLPGSDEYWMAAALARAAVAAQQLEVPVGAVIVREGEIIGEGWNQPISGNDPTAHGEVMALRDAAQRVGNYRLVDADLYVTIEPCMMCVGAMVHARIRRLIFGATEPKAGAVISQLRALELPHLNHQIEFRGGVLADQCSEQIRAFFRSRRQK